MSDIPPWARPPRDPADPGEGQAGEQTGERTPPAAAAPPVFPPQFPAAPPQFPIPTPQQPPAAPPQFPIPAQQQEQPPAAPPQFPIPAQQQPPAAPPQFPIPAQQEEQPPAAPPQFPIPAQQEEQPPAAPPQFPVQQPPAAPPQFPVAPQPVASPPPASQPTTPPVPAPLPAEPEPPTPFDEVIAGAPVEAQPPRGPMPFETTALPDVAPDARDAPPFWEPEPTQLMDAVELVEDRPAEPAPPQPFGRSVFPEGSELLPDATPAAPAAEPEAGFAPAPGETGPVSALDALFGESQFREYTEGPDPNESPFARREAPPTPPPGDGTRAPKPAGPPAAISPVQRTLLIVLGSLLALLVLAGLFFLGTRLTDLLGPAPAVVAPSASPSPSATVPVIAVGPVAPGVYPWDELLGGECLEPFGSPWDEEFTVVACDQPHHGQMIHTAEFADPETGPEPFPGADQLQARALDACQAGPLYSPGAVGLQNAVVGVSYPPTEEEWDAGNRRYYCFVSLSTGEPLPGDIAAPQPTPVPEAEPTP